MSETYSYSKLSCFNECKYKYYQKYVLKIKVPFETSLALEKGGFIHYLLEHHPNDVLYKLNHPEAILKEQEYRNFVKKLVIEDQKVSALLNDKTLYSREERFYLANDFSIVEGKNESTYNGIIDYVGLNKDTIILADWKTGKTQNLASLDQLEFYTLWAFQKFPDATQVMLFLMFIEQNAVQSRRITKDNLNELQLKYSNLIAEIENTTDYKKKRTSKCEYCAFLKECIKL